MHIFLSRLNYLIVGLLGGCVVILTGCVTVKTQDDGPAPVPVAVSRPGVYHKVEPGESLWRIAKIYNVSIGEITRANNIPETAAIEKNQLLFIPGANAVEPVPLEAEKAQNEFIWPLKGKVIRHFHERQGDRISKGIDIRAHEGDAVKAARMGRVVFADYLTGYGYTVILDHLDGLRSVYAMNARLLVRLDDVVIRSTEIALVGRSGGSAYLHFQIRKKSIEDNPLFYLP